MSGDDIPVHEAQNDPSPRVDRDDPAPRPMIAVLDTKPGIVGPLREVISELVRQARREPGCLTLTAYHARDPPTRFHLHELYANAAAIADHLQTRHVHNFIAAVPARSTVQPGSPIQLAKEAAERMARALRDAPQEDGSGAAEDNF